MHSHINGTGISAFNELLNSCIVFNYCIVLYCLLPQDLVKEMVASDIALLSRDPTA